MAVTGSPPGGAISYSWCTTAHGPWSAKTAGLLFDLLRLAPNTKLLSQRVTRSMWILFEKKNLLPENKAQYKAEDLVDKMDIAIRLLLSHLRAMKQKESLKQSVQVPVARGSSVPWLHILFRVCFSYKS